MSGTMSAGLALRRDEYPADNCAADRYRRQRRDRIEADGSFDQFSIDCHGGFRVLRSRGVAAWVFRRRGGRPRSPYYVHVTYDSVTAGRTLSAAGREVGRTDKASCPLPVSGTPHFCRELTCQLRDDGAPGRVASRILAVPIIFIHFNSLRVINDVRCRWRLPHSCARVAPEAKSTETAPLFRLLLISTRRAPGELRKRAGH